MTVADDLATLRQSVRFSNAQPRLSVSWECNAALDRVEAEIARLERERDMARASRDDWELQAKGRGVVQHELLERAEATEAEAARLRDGLRAYRSALRSGEPESPQLAEIARVLLAEDGAA